MLSRSIQKFFEYVDKDLEMEPWYKNYFKAMLCYYPEDGLARLAANFGFPDALLPGLKNEIKELRNQDKIREFLASIKVDIGLALDNTKAPPPKKKKPIPEVLAPRQGPAAKMQSVQKTSAPSPFDLTTVSGGPNQLGDVLERAALRAEAGLPIAPQDAQTIVQLIKERKTRK